MKVSRKVFRLAKRMWWWWWWCVVNHVQDIRNMYSVGSPYKDCDCTRARNHVRQLSKVSQFKLGRRPVQLWGLIIRHAYRSGSQLFNLSSFLRRISTEKSSQGRRRRAVRAPRTRGSTGTRRDDAGAAGASHATRFIGRGWDCRDGNPQPG